MLVRNGQIGRALALAGAVVLGYGVGVVWRAPARVLWRVVRPQPEPPADLELGPRLPDALAGIYDSAYHDLTAFLEQRVDAARTVALDWDTVVESTSAMRRAQVKAAIHEEIARDFPPFGAESPELAAIEFPWYESPLHRAIIVRIWSLPGVRTWLAVYRPRVAQGPWPTIIFLHGFAGTLEGTAADLDYHHGIAAQLADKGFMVLAPYVVSAEVQRRARIQLLALWSGTSALNVSRWILERVVDYATSVPDVDATHLGVYGISGGGDNALRLAALDERLSLAIVSGFFTDRFHWWYGRPDTIRTGHLLNAMSTTVVLDDMNWVALIHPRFFAVESGRSDPRHERALAEWGEVEALYASTQSTERAAFLEFEGGHETSIDAVFPFLDRWRAAQVRPPRR